MKHLITISLFFFMGCAIPEKQDYKQYGSLMDPNINPVFYKDSILWDSFHLQHDSAWHESDYGLIADHDDNGQYIKYKVWAQGIDIYTYKDRHHGRYKVTIDGEVKDTVDCYNPDRVVEMTFSIRGLSYGNHEIEINPLDNLTKTFVFEKIVTWTDPIPYPPPDSIPPDIIPPIEPCLDSIIYFADTVRIVDTIFIKEIDTIYLQPKIFIKADSIEYEIK